MAQLIVDGHTTREIVTKIGLSADTIRLYVREIRESVHCPPRSKPQVLVHLLMATEQVTPPTTDRATPQLNDAQQLLLQALTAHSNLRAVALDTGIAPADAQSAVDALLHETGASDVTQLVVLAHAWGLLGARTTGTMTRQANQ
ncbi:DNA-binding protein [Streptomyces sp. NPDC006978]|uniref:DNA-binding protein n=1 Tax=Streptomyces sp. NPDC006978 TaxID=3364769 RepID=UPI0036BFF33E